MTPVRVLLTCFQCVSNTDEEKGRDEDEPRRGHPDEISACVSDEVFFFSDIFHRHFWAISVYISMCMYIATLYIQM